jgi:hypothetical protein
MLVVFEDEKKDKYHNEIEIRSKDDYLAKPLSSRYYKKSKG